MNSIHSSSLARKQSGFLLYAAMVLMTVLLGTGLAFMRWSADEALQTAESAAGMQAYYLAQMGIVERGFTWLRNQPAAQLPIGETVMEGERVPGVGFYENVIVTLLTSTEGGDFWAQDRQYRITAIGVVRIPTYDGRHSGYKDIRRKAVLYVQLRNFADYMYLSDQEMTNFGDRIKFWHGDTLNGRVHSNSLIAIMQDPVFYDVVSTTEDDFWHGAGYNPQFEGPPPVFNTPSVEIPVVAENLRAGAISQGNYYHWSDWTYYFSFHGGYCTASRWPTGSEIDTLSNSWQVNMTDRTCMFAEGPVFAKGLVTGRVTFGSAQLVRLMDDITVSGHDSRGRVPMDNTNMIGIVSEGDVKIANTWENGRENSRYNSSIIITGAIVALGESFTFENQNDPDSGYVCTCVPDDRGQIFMFGSVTQMRRGYVHRSTNNSTGYLKQYIYDRRLLRKRPPCFFDATDEDGRALFNVVQWGQGIENPAEVARWNIVRYN